MTSTNSLVAAKEASSGIQLSLHPVVILHISDHLTRAKFATNNPNPRVVGALLGKQSGRNVEILLGYELVFKEENGIVEITQAFLNEKTEHMKKVFKNYDFLGWYQTGSKVTEADLNIHKQFQEVNENPLYMLVDAKAAAPGARELPIYVYEAEVHVVKDQPVTQFVKLGYKIETVDAERISVDTIARVVQSGGTGSTLSSHLFSVHSAVNTLTLRIKMLQKYLEAVKTGATPKDHGVLRRIVSLCNQLPTIDTTQFKQDFMSEYNDALMVTYLAAITKSAAAANELIDRFSVVQQKSRRGGGLSLLA